ncbi:MAG: diguanylate cyclase [Halarcobacter sp.]
MKTVNLKNLIYQNYLKTALTSIIFIEITLLFLYFNVTNNLVNKSSSFIIKDLRETVYSKIDDIKDDINRNLLDIEKIALLFQNEHQNFFKYYKNIKIDKKPKFKVAENGMYYKSVDNGGSFVIVSKDIKIDKTLQDELDKTELFDKSFKIAVDNNKMITSAYYNSKYNYSRYYPYLKDPYKTFPASFDIKKYNFFYKADLIHNPERKVVWTDIYLDPAGQGWMISSLVPIYYNNKLEGVTGFDITIEKIIESLLEIKIPYNADSFLLDNQGDIIATTDGIKAILGIDFNRYKYKKDEKVNGTILKEKINILNHKNKQLVSILKDILKNKKYKNELEIDGKKYLLFTEYIEKTSWHIVSLIKQENILKEVNELEDYYIDLGILIISLIILFYTLFFIYLYKKSNNFVKRINDPLLKIISLTKNLAKQKHIKSLSPTGVEELDILNKNFNNMIEELENRTEKLIEAEANKAMHEHLSNTDVLTGAYNRRFLNDFSKNYFEIVKREKSTLSLLMIDIDDFKHINDQYGHNTGDKILQTLVNEIKELLRENDIIVRFGGDEFLVLLPDVNLENSKIVGNKILKKINKLQNDIENIIVKFTISIGCTEYLKNDDKIEDMVIRADKSLYYSKEKGKNTIS